MVPVLIALRNTEAAYGCATRSRHSPPQILVPSTTAPRLEGSRSVAHLAA